MLIRPSVPPLSAKSSYALSLFTAKSEEAQERPKRSPAEAKSKQEEGQNKPEEAQKKQTRSPEEAQRRLEEARRNPEKAQLTPAEEARRLIGI